MSNKTYIPEWNKTIKVGDELIYKSNNDVIYKIVNIFKDTNHKISLTIDSIGITVPPLKNIYNNLFISSITQCFTLKNNDNNNNNIIPISKWDLLIFD